MADTTTERRQHVRTAVALDARLERISGRPLAGSASTMDLSSGGARFVGPSGFAVGDVLHIEISKGDVAVKRQGLVVGRQANGKSTATLNVAFKTIDTNAVGDLERIIGAYR